MSSTVAKPWYRELWFWLLISPMLTLIVSVPLMLTTAFKNADDRVIDDYYQEGRMINNRFEAQAIAADLNIQGSLRFDWQSGELWFVVNHELSDETLTLFFSHPAKAKFDFSLTLKRVDRTRYRVDLPSMSRGRWYLSLEGVHDNTPWRIASDVDLAKVEIQNLIAVRH